MLRLRSLASPHHKFCTLLVGVFLLYPCVVSAQGVDDLEKAVQVDATSEARPVAEYVTRPDDDLLLLTLNLGNVILLDLLLAYEDLETGKYYISLSDFVKSLEFPIEVDLDDGNASGWFLDESRQFSLNLAEGRAVVAGQDYTLSSQDVERHEDGIYVSLELLQKWFPVTLDVDFSQLAIVIKSLEPLPIEVRMIRDEKRKKVSDGSRRFRHKRYPLEEVDDPLFTYPIANISAQSRYDGQEGNDERLSASTSLLASSVVAGQDFVLSVNDTTQGNAQADIRATLSRKDVDGDLFGAGLSEYSLGDVNSAAIPLLTTGAAGRGVSVSSFPFGYSSEAQSGTAQLRGELPVGYQIDVMRNGQLLGFQEEPDENGEYLFDLDVLPGLNVFELVFYGPQGQKEVQEKRFFVSANPIKDGAFEFKADFIQRDTNLFTDRNIGQDADQGKYRTSIQAQYGLGDQSSLYAAFADVSVEGERKRYGLMRYSRSFIGVRADLSYARSSDSGQSASVRFQSVFRGISWQMQHDYYNRFVSEDTLRANLGGDLEHRTNVRLSGLLPVLKNIPFSLNLERYANTDKEQRIEWQGRLTKNISKLRITGELSQEIETNEDRETDLGFQVSSRFQDFTLRGNVVYALEPEYELNRVSLDADWRIGDRSVLSAGVRRSGAEDPVHSVTLGASHNFDAIGLGFDVTYDDTDEFRALLNTAFSIGYSPHESSVFMRQKRLAQTAFFTPRVFYDRNNNHIYDDDDAWMSDVGFVGSRINRKAFTDEKGHVFLTGVPPYRRVTLDLDESSLPDPFMRSVVPPRDYILRPTQGVYKEFPVVLVGEVDGDVSFVKRGRRREAQSITVQVVDAGGGDVIAQGVTEFDGFIWIQDVPMGDYHLRIDPDQLQELGYCTPLARDVSLSVEEPFVSAGSFMLWPSLQEGKVGIALSELDEKKGLEALWDLISVDLGKVLLDRNNYPASYIVQHEGDDRYQLVLYDMDQEVAGRVCDALFNGECAFIKPEHQYCPTSVFEIAQVADVMAHAGRGKSNGVEDDRGEDLGFDDLKDLTEEDIIKAIGN
ncbi:MAG: hypothetical protein ACRBDL_05525 [Alphaproteobacteria bacterium]